MEKRKIINTDITIGSYQNFIHTCLDLSTSNLSSYICVSNVHMAIEGYRDPLFQKIVNEAAISTPDGMPLAKAINWLYGIEQERVAGMDLMPDLMQVSEKNGFSIYFYGSTDEILSKIIKKAKIEFPNLDICGTYSPPFREIDEGEKIEIIQRINGANPNFVFVALGCPKQEKWMAEHRGKINSCMIGLGGAFEVYAEVKKRAPQWMQDTSLEWVYRLMQDPKRLWKRYMTTNFIFIWLVLKQWIEIKLIRNGL